MYPLRTSKPEFDEQNPRSLRRYFEDVDELCTLNGGQTSKEKIHRALYYTPDPDTEDLWRGIIQIISLYPGAEGGFSYPDLERFTEKASRKRLTCEADIGRYHRQFTNMANNLMSDQTLHIREANYKYAKGIPQDFWGKIEKYFLVRGADARSQSRDDIYKAALWLIRSEKNGNMFR
ncbi:hypothetical protein C8R44DRAFT_748227 [Mycena epipterygia]|nr:hypothetical protein C8R44DRAFT_748227 [Mycena epipterygia]